MLFLKPINFFNIMVVNDREEFRKNYFQSFQKLKKQKLIIIITFLSIYIYI